MHGDATRLPTGANVNLGDIRGCDVEAVQLVAEDGGRSRGNLYTPSARRPRLGVHIMHPRTDQSLNYNVPHLVEAGCMVLARAGRWVNNDTTTVHETLLFDVAAGVRLLRDRGCDTVVLLGNSGGAPLAAFYQWQASAEPSARLDRTPAGDPVDLPGADLPAADAIVIIGGHPGEAISLMKRIDPSVTDEFDPLSLDVTLDMHDPANGFATPPTPSKYSEEFLARYITAQHARVTRIDAIARDEITRRRAAEEEFRRSPSAAVGRAASFSQPVVVHRTMADPAMLDLSIEPDDRRLSAYTNHLRPDLLNFGGAIGDFAGQSGQSGLVKFLTPEAWLSTWSANTSRADTEACLASLTQPFLTVHYLGDNITQMTKVRSTFDAAKSATKDLVLVPRADHFGFPINPDGTSGPRTTEGTAAVTTWLHDHFATDF
jgi:pimeloyl-ACP methyl ester carboxylesterase